MKAIGRGLLFVGWIGLLAAVAIGLPAVGLDVPAVTDFAGWGDWFSRRPPVESAFGVLQVAVWATSWYLIGVSTIGAVARLLRLGKVVRAVDVVTLPMVRRLLQASFGFGLVAASFAGMPEHTGSTEQLHAAQPTHATGVLSERMQRAGEMESMRLAGSDSLMLRYLGSSGAEAAMLRLEIAEPDAEPEARDAESEARAAESEARDAESEARDAESEARDVADAAGATSDGTSDGKRIWEVVPGEHFWGIAEQVLTETWERSPSNVELIPYWQELIDANKDELADQNNPDLIFPGQKFVVPDPPAAP